MHILLMISFFCALAWSEVIDLGTVAETYPIKEKSFKVSIREGIEDFNVTLAKKQIVESFRVLVEAKSDLPLSMKDAHYIKNNTYIVPSDIVGPHGVHVYHAGESVKVSMPKGIQMSLCFVDATHSSLLPLIAKKFGSCIYMVANNKNGLNYPSLIKNSTDGKVYPLSDRYVKRFDVSALPTKIVLRGAVIEYTVLNMKKIMKEGGIK